MSLYGLASYDMVVYVENIDYIIWQNAGVILWQKAGDTIWQNAGNIISFCVVKYDLIRLHLVW